VSWLTPWVAAGLAAAVIPPLILLYFLKLRRREQSVSSTLLWKRAVQDLQVNAPFQRLRKNLLLLLQLLVLAAALLALGRPIVETEAARESSLIILIDRSGSMNAREDRGTRLDEAKEQAVRLLRSVNRTGARWFSLGGDRAATRVMVIAFADRATVISPFTTNTSELVELVRAIEPTDAATNLDEALALAEAYLAQTALDPTLAPGAAGADSRLVLLTDGNISDTADSRPRYGTLEHLRIGDTDDNVGITALRVERNYERPELVDVFIEVRNFGARSARSDVTLHVDDRLRSVGVADLAPGRLPAAEPAPDAPPTSHQDAAPDGSRATLSFDFTLDAPGIVKVALSRDDALTADNAAWAVVPPPRKLRVLLVTPQPFFLERVLAGLPLESVRRVSPAEYDALPRAELEIDGFSRFDVVVCDRHSPAELPAGNYLFIGAVPPLEGLSTAGMAERLIPLWWDEHHPVLRHVAFEYVYVAESLQLTLPPKAEVLAEGPRGPLLARVSQDGRHCLVLAFAVENSTWWSKPSFPVFFYNALRYLGSAGAGTAADSLRPGAAVDVTLAAGAADGHVVRPDGTRTALRPGTGGVASFAGTNRVGLYRVEPGSAGRDRFAVNLLDAVESDIRPRELTTLGGRAVVQGTPIRTATPEVWRWFVGAALVLLMIEWIIYNRRVLI